MLAGCAREERPVAPAEPAGPAETATPARSDSRPVIVAFGDSLTAGHGVEPGLSYPDFLQKELDRRGYGYRVVNQGISGDTTGGGVSGGCLERDVIARAERIRASGRAGAPGT